jgi:hypothetical protein
MISTYFTRPRNVTVFRGSRANCNSMSAFSTGTSNSFMLHPGAQTKALNRSVGAGISKDALPRRHPGHLRRIGSARPTQPVAHIHLLGINAFRQNDPYLPHWVPWANIAAVSNNAAMQLRIMPKIILSMHAHLERRRLSWRNQAITRFDCSSMRVVAMNIN